LQSKTQREGRVGKALRVENLFENMEGVGKSKLGDH